MWMRIDSDTEQRVKMKARNYLSMAAAAILLAACSNEGTPEGLGPEDHTPVAVRIHAGIDDMKSRVDGTSWTVGDTIGVYVTSAGSTAGTNVPYRKTADGWEPLGEPIYFADKEEATFNAYYPYREPGKMVDGKILIPASDPWERAKTDDLLFASGAVASKSDPNVGFTGDHLFRHRMSQLTITLKAGRGVPDLDRVNRIVIEGTLFQGNFAPASNIIYLDNVGSFMHEDHLDGVPAGAKSYTLPTALCIPSSSRFNFSIVMDGETVTYHAFRYITLSRGINHLYTVTINNTELEINQVDIGDWEEQPEYDVDAELQ